MSGLGGLERQRDRLAGPVAPVGLLDPADDFEVRWAGLQIGDDLLGIGQLVALKHAAAHPQRRP